MVAENDIPTWEAKRIQLAEPPCPGLMFWSHRTQNRITLADPVGENHKCWWLKQFNCTTGLVKTFSTSNTHTFNTKFVGTRLPLLSPKYWLNVWNLIEWYLGLCPKFVIHARFLFLGKEGHLCRRRCCLSEQCCSKPIRSMRDYRNNSLTYCVKVRAIIRSIRLLLGWLSLSGSLDSLLEFCWWNQLRFSCLKDKLLVRWL